MNTTTPFLIWEDEDAGSERWWLSRAREVTAEGRSDYFIAEDDVTGTLVGVALPPEARRYRVVTVVPLTEARGEALAAAKTGILSWRLAPMDPARRRAIRRWRLVRAVRVVARYLPLVFAGLAIGGLLGFAVALFAVSSGTIGWPMTVVGLILGASAGPVLKVLVDLKFKGIAAGPWTRFAVATGATAAGAAASVISMLTLFWS